jgi:hypothetical protein
MALNATALDSMLAGLGIDKVSLHSGDPGVAGDGNVVGAATAVTLADAADNGDGKRKRQVSTQVDFTGLTPAASVVNFGWWDDSVFLGYTPRDSGDAAVNAAGEYSVTTATKFVHGNAA